MINDNWNRWRVEKENKWMAKCHCQFSSANLIRWDMRLIIRAHSPVRYTRYQCKSIRIGWSWSPTTMSRVREISSRRKGGDSRGGQSAIGQRSYILLILILVYLYTATQNTDNNHDSNNNNDNRRANMCTVILKSAITYGYLVTCTDAISQCHISHVSFLF